MTNIKYASHFLTSVLLFFTITFFVKDNCYAQTTLTGTVRNAAGQPLEGILLEVETKAQPPASAFVISGADGGFKLSLPATATATGDSLRLSARALGYAAQLRRLLNRSQTVELRMREKATKLREAAARQHMQQRAKRAGNPLELR